MGDDPALLARRFWALPSCSPARRVRPASGLLPPDPTGEGCPSCHRAGLPSARTEFPSTRCAVVSSGSGPQGCPCIPARTKVPRPAKPRGFHPPTYAPRHPQRVHRGSPFSSTPYGALGHGPGVVQGGQAHRFTPRGVTRRARPLSGGLPGRRSGTPPAQAPPPHPATDRSGSVPSWVKSERRMADIGILSTQKYSNPHPQGDMRLRMASRRTRDFSRLIHRGQRHPRPSRRRPERVCSSG